MSLPLMLCVDVGAAGGLAWIAKDGSPQACAMPGTDEALLWQLKAIAGNWSGSAPGNRCDFAGGPAFIELVGGFIKTRQRENDEDEGGAQPGSAMFKFGEGAGLVRGMLLALGARVEMVRPQQWQQIIFEKRANGQDKASWKRVLKAAAQRRFPSLKVTLKTADALLMLAYKCPQIVRGGIRPPAEAQRRQGGQGRRKDAAPERVSGEYYWENWKGEPWIFKKQPNGTFTLVAKATANEVTKLPKLPA